MNTQTTNTFLHRRLATALGFGLILATACKNTERPGAAISTVSRDFIPIVDSAIAYYDRAVDARSEEGDTAVVIGGMPMRVEEFRRSSDGYTVILEPQQEGYEGGGVTLELDLAGNVQSMTFDL